MRNVPPTLAGAGNGAQPDCGTDALKRLRWISCTRASYLTIEIESTLIVFLFVSPVTLTVMGDALPAF
jgi:hypothetical protein